jgi:hypothetical protein
MQAFIISGTLNTTANYARVGYGEYGSRDEFPCVLLFPKTKKMLVFMNMRDAVVYRNTLLDNNKDMV